MRSPTRAPGSASGAAASLGAADELRGRHAMARGEDVHVAGLRRVELVEAGGLERGGDLIRQRVTPSLRAPGAPRAQR